MHRPRLFSAWIPAVLAFAVLAGGPAGARAEVNEDPAAAVVESSAERTADAPEALAAQETAADSLLDESELAELAARDEEPGREVVGGALNNQQLTYIAIALAAAVIVLIAK